MIIKYNKNPLLTKVELNEFEKKELWYKIKIEELNDLLFDAHYSLKNNKEISDIKKGLEPSYYLNENDDGKSELDLHCDYLLNLYLEELQSSHAGDCICFPCSCAKCHVEYLLGIDTIKGLGKHSAYKINNAFGKDNVLSIEDALNHLKNYEIVIDNPEQWKSVGGYEQHIPRWKQEAELAYKWLLEYNKTYQEFIKNNADK